MSRRRHKPHAHLPATHGARHKDPGCFTQSSLVAYMNKKDPPDPTRKAMEHAWRQMSKKERRGLFRPLAARAEEKMKALIEADTADALEAAARVADQVASGAAVESQAEAIARKFKALASQRETP